MKLVLLSSLILLFACAEKGSSSKTKLQIRARDLIVSSRGLEQSGGVVVVGRSEAKKAMLTFYLTSATEVLTVELPNDVWEFSAAGWEGGSGIMSGSVRCSGIVTKNLIGSPESVELTINKTNCANTVYTATGLFDSTTQEVLPFKLQSCYQLDIDGNCVGGVGRYKSFRVGHPITYGAANNFFYEYEMNAWDSEDNYDYSVCTGSSTDPSYCTEEKEPTWPPFVRGPRAFSSECVNLDSTGVATTDFHIPTGGFDSDGAVFPFIIPYEQADCAITVASDEYQAYFFDDDNGGDTTDANYTPRIKVMADGGYMLTRISDDSYDSGGTVCPVFSDYTSITESDLGCYTSKLGASYINIGDLAVGDILVYVTETGGVGKMKINSVSASSVDYDYVTYLNGATYSGSLSHSFMSGYNYGASLETSSPTVATISGTNYSIGTSGFSSSLVPAPGTSPTGFLFGIAGIMKLSSPMKLKMIHSSTASNDFPELLSSYESDGSTPHAAESCLPLQLAVLDSNNKKYQGTFVGFSAYMHVANIGCSSLEFYGKETDCINGVGALSTPSFSFATSSPLSSEILYYKASGCSSSSASDILFYARSAVTDVESQYMYLKFMGVPSLSSFSASSGNYKAGDTISFMVYFSDMVDVVGTPTLSLNTGGVATYTEGSGSMYLYFDYIVSAGESASVLDYTSTTALNLNGGSIKSSTSGMDAGITLPTPGTTGSLSDFSIVVDTYISLEFSSPAVDGDIYDGSVDNIVGLCSDEGQTVTFSVTSGDGVLSSTSSTCTGGYFYLTPVFSTQPTVDSSITIEATHTDLAGNTITVSRSFIYRGV